jgi:hypothetical protein
MLKSKLEHKFFCDGIEQTINGYIEEDFVDKFLQFVLDLNRPNTDVLQLHYFEKDVINSKAVEMNNLSRFLQIFMTKFLAKMKKKNTSRGILQALLALKKKKTLPEIDTNT